MRRLLLLFLDGVGLGSDDPADNPFLGAELPVIRGLLDGEAPVRSATPLMTARATLTGIDAGLGVPGLPQSGTGQAALLTGENCARAFGRHFGPWTPTSLRPLVRERSLLARAAAAGLEVAFANAYPEELVRRPESEWERLPMPLRSGPVIAALGAGVLTRYAAELARGEAVASEMVNDGWRERLGRSELPVITPEQAGANLARIAGAHRLTFFAHYSTDAVGHGRALPAAVAALERVDRFLGGVLEGLADGTTLLVASDHGNIEDVRVGHTRNPALGLVVGEGHQELAARLESLTDIAPAVLGTLGVR